MPEFCNAFSGLAAGRKLTHRELVRAIRYMISAEYEAIQLYEQLAESIDCELARKVLLDVADEEKEHAGEFRRLLSMLAPEDEPFYADGMKETDEAAAELESDCCCKKDACCAESGDCKC
ncbi:MAG TPA: rubrerythrin [Candidatus Akkermansia intestinigallinarum]|uniref:Rubrerythrin n=1 Tax=Candidatus Akkermansia intestinigallinarum TaxID=2838431 RepID=A0A9D1VAD2_9BACT|nr:rubrerythrin [Candidatus Akkermansia intestinigallinarum]